MENINLKSELKELYTASSKVPSIIEIPTMNYIKLDGMGTPKDKEFQYAAETLYPIAYTLKFMVRQSLNLDFKVMPMEVLWRIDREKKKFFWTMMVMQPECITGELFETACKRVQEKFSPKLLDEARFEDLTEGICVQMMHRGAYEQMNDTLNKMLEYINQKGYTSERDTHDIYLNNVKKTRQENLKTIMRLRVYK